VVNLFPISSLCSDVLLVPPTLGGRFVSHLFACSDVLLVPLTSWWSFRFPPFRCSDIPPSHSLSPFHQLQLQHGGHFVSHLFTCSDVLVVPPTLAVVSSPIYLPVPTFSSFHPHLQSFRLPSICLFRRARRSTHTCSRFVSHLFACSDVLVVPPTFGSRFVSHLFACSDVLPVPPITTAARWSFRLPLIRLFDVLPFHSRLGWSFRFPPFSFFRRSSSPLFPSRSTRHHCNLVVSLPQTFSLLLRSSIPPRNPLPLQPLCWII
jgi:hypothetical protein